jgi:hypothetical protein
MINFKEKKILIRTSQANMTRRKNVIMSDEPRLKIIKPRSPEPRVWKVNQMRWSRPRVKPTSDMLLEKYVHQQRRSVVLRPRGSKRQRSPGLDAPNDQQEWRRSGRLCRELGTHGLEQSVVKDDNVAWLGQLVIRREHGVNGTTVPRDNATKLVLMWKKRVGGSSSSDVLT